jgi:NAD(P)-dependent dehydrogenase (short-subunit alcohol dehydrogenase family)
MNLAEKVCLITNCGDLQGGPDAAEFQRQGAVLVLQARDLGRASEELRRHEVDLDGGPAGAPVRLIEADFGEPGVASRELDVLVRGLGRLDVLVNNNAPPHIEKPLSEISDEEWREMFHRIVDELFFTTRAALQHMLPAGRGKILNIGAAGGIDPYRGPYTAYCSARGAIVTLTKALGRELAPHNIQVTAIAQNYVENPSYFLADEVEQPEFQEWLRSHVPAQRLAKPWEQAKLAAFLVSDDADYLAGVVVPFSGGDVL